MKSVLASKSNVGSAYSARDGGSGETKKSGKRRFAIIVEVTRLKVGVDDSKVGIDDM